MNKKMSGMSGIKYRNEKDITAITVVVILVPVVSRKVSQWKDITAIVTVIRVPVIPTPNIYCLNVF